MKIHPTAFLLKRAYSQKMIQTVEIASNLHSGHLHTKDECEELESENHSQTCSVWRGTGEVLESSSLQGRTRKTFRAF